MKKKSIVCGILASSVALSVMFGGCSLVSTNTAADMNQTVAEVDISKAVALDKEFEEYKEYMNAVGTTSIIKRELIAYFINYGYSIYQQNQSYEKTFNTLLDQLVDNAIVVQYSTVYLLKEKATVTSEEGETSVDESVISTYKGLKSEKEKYEYLLGTTEEGDSKEVKIAKYNLYYSINSAIDVQEKKILEEETSNSGTDTRTTPSGVDTQKDDYYPQVSDTDDRLDYNIYTGYNIVDKDGKAKDYSLDNSGAYKKDKLEGSTNATRIAAYREFLEQFKNSAYDLVDTKTEDLSDVLSLKYIEYEYVNQLKQGIINKYYDVYEAKQEDLLKGLGDSDNNNDYAAINAEYQNKLGTQKENYKKEGSFTSAMDSMSDSSFVLYAPSTEDTDNGGRFGFVYNILLPFSETQSDLLSGLKSMYANSDLDGGYEPAYYVERNNLLSEIKTTDQRSAWFNGETDYAFKVADDDTSIDIYKNGKNSSWLFFENNVSNTDKYEALDKYAGHYPYNGTVVDRKDDYVLIPNELSIDGSNDKQSMLDEFVAYIDHVMRTPGAASYEKTENYGVDLKNNLYKKGDDGKNVLINGKKIIDYSNFIYATGQVNFGIADKDKAEKDNRANLLNKDSAQYKALSAVNELQYAYTTDTGVLSQYLGYSVQAGDTSYIKEFEHAAHDAVARGAGSFAVCAGDYGWHLIYVTYTFSVNDAQYEPDWAANIDKEGTFENLFYEYYKSQKLPNISSTRRNKIILNFKDDETVIKYESRYKNLFDLDKK